MEKKTNMLILLKKALDEADAVVIGAGAGLSSAAGMTYSGQRFTDHFQDFADRYGFQDMYSGGFYPFAALEEYWAYWSRFIELNRYCSPPYPVYDDLLELVKNKDYFVITTNVDHQFQKSGFERKRLFYMQGDFGLWQCSVPCHPKTYDNEAFVHQMIRQQADCRIPPALIPVCPRCGKPMSMNLRMDTTFVEDEGCHSAAQRYNQFLYRHQNHKVVFFELGVGWNTPGIIRYPFWQRTKVWPQAVYVSVNLEGTVIPNEIRSKTVSIQDDLRHVITQLRSLDQSSF